MDPTAIALAIGAWLLLRSRDGAEETPTDPSDVAAGAVPEGGAGLQYGQSGIVAGGDYEDGQRVIVRQAYRFAYHYGRGPTGGTSWAISNPVGAGPNAAPWTYGRAGAGVRDGAGADISVRFRRAMPTNNVPGYAPVYPQLHPLYTLNGGGALTPGQHGSMPDGPTSPNSSRYPTDFQAPNVGARGTKSLPGLIIQTDDGATPLVESWFTVNYSGITLNPGTLPGENPFRLFVGADHYTAARKVGSRWVHVSFAELRARIGWRQPGKGRFPPGSRGAGAYRSNIPASANIWSVGPFGTWLDGVSRSRGRGAHPGPAQGNRARGFGYFDCTAANFCADWAIPGQDGAFFQSCVDSAKLRAAGVPSVHAIACPVTYRFPNEQGWPTDWTGRRSFFELGLFLFIISTADGPRQQPACVMNAQGMRPVTFDYPRRRGSREYLDSVNLLPYPPTVSRLLAELRAKTYVRHFPVE